MSREWSCAIYVAQCDLTKAFDKVKHSAVIRALKLQSASLQCIGLFCAMILQSNMAFKMGPIISDSVELERGVPQGAPESPLIFVLVMEMVLRPLLRSWQERGLEAA